METCKKRIENINEKEYPGCLKKSGGQSDIIFCNDKNFIIKKYKKKKGKFIKRAEREVKCLMKLKNEGICPEIIDKEIGKDKACILMKKIEGKELNKYVEDTTDINSRLETFKNLLDATKLCHSNNIFHRDLKPGNIMVGEKGNVYLLDFGISIGEEEKQGDFSWVDDDRPRLGSIFFQCPESEVILEDSDYKKINKSRFDLYSLGKILYYIIRVNGKNHGFFPREKYAEPPWLMEEDGLFVFIPVIGSVVTENWQSARIKDIDELIELFNTQKKKFNSIPIPPDQASIQKLKDSIEKDVKFQTHKIQENNKRTKQKSIFINISNIEEKIKDIFEDAYRSLHPSGGMANSSLVHKKRWNSPEKHRGRGAEYGFYFYPFDDDSPAGWGRKSELYCSIQYYDLNSGSQIEVFTPSTYGNDVFEYLFRMRNYIKRKKVGEEEVLMTIHNSSSLSEEAIDKNLTDSLGSIINEMKLFITKNYTSFS